MTRILITSLKIFLVLALVLALAVGGVMLADSQQWPRWVVAVGLAGIFFIVVLILFARRYHFRRREERFVKRVVDYDNKAIEAAPGHERRSLEELQERWAAAVEALRSSRLRHRGDPLYSLPWFMILGETSSGKSTAVSSARLTSILTDVGPTKGMASTRNCDWWFFENAVILDTAGRYAVPQDNEDRLEWERFLTLLARYRRKEPLNGLIVTLPADRLIAGDMDELTEYGRSIRMRVDQLMRVLGARFPVYILVTKIDLVMGMSAMADMLPANLRFQAMGLLNQHEKRLPVEFLKEAIGHVFRRLKDLRLQLASRGGKHGGRAVLFPDELERLSPGINTFVKSAFSENPYQETPFLRGVFISSGRQSGLSSSRLLGSLKSFKGREWRLPETGAGLFLHDLFASILPRDRRRFGLLGEYMSWKTATANLALGAWLLLLLTAAGTASLSYVHIRSAMEPVYSSFQSAPELGESVSQDIVTLGLLRDRIVEMESRMRSRVWPLMGFTQGNQALEGLKTRYNEWFRKFVLNPTDAAMRERFVTLGTHDREEAMVRYLEHLVWRIDVLREREAGRRRTVEPREDNSVQALALAFGGRLPYVASFFPDMYRSFAAWEPRTDNIRRERSEIQVWVNRVVEVEGLNLRWLVDWADTRTNIPEVTLSDFWPVPGPADRAARVSRAFTAEGRGEIEKLLQQVAQAARDSDEFKERTDLFWQWYAKSYYRQWARFADDFDLGIKNLLTRQDWLSAGSTMATLDNPYFSLISRMESEFENVRDLAPPPQMARLPKRFELVVNHYRAGLQQHQTLTEMIQDRIKRLEAAVEQFEKTIEANDEFEEYMKHKAEFLPVIASMKAAYRFSMQNFGPAAGDAEQASPVESAQAMLTQIRSILGQGLAEEEPFWILVGGPLKFLITLVTLETACAVNDFWESQVLAETARVPDQELWDVLFGEKNLVMEFVSGSAKPFLRRGLKGWAPTAWFGVPFPFREEFLDFLDRGSERRQQLQPEYTVTISALPTNVNREAKSEPYQTNLTLQCGTGAQSLDNFNFPDSLDFVWDPAICDNVTLTIFFREATLTRTWSGQWGFRDFLREFRDGRRAYSPEDFPKQRDMLEGLGVQNIQVNYVFHNSEPVITLEDYPPLKVPGQATYCWAGPGKGAVP